MKYIPLVRIVQFYKTFHPDINFDINQAKLFIIKKYQVKADFYVNK